MKSATEKWNNICNTPRGIFVATFSWLLSQCALEQRQNTNIGQNVPVHDDRNLSCEIITEIVRTGFGHVFRIRLRDSGSLWRSCFWTVLWISPEWSLEALPAPYYSVWKAVHRNDIGIFQNMGMRAPKGSEILWTEERSDMDSTSLGFGRLNFEMSKMFYMKIALLSRSTRNAEENISDFSIVNCRYITTSYNACQSCKNGVVVYRLRGMDVSKLWCFLNVWL